MFSPYSRGVRHIHSLCCSQTCHSRLDLDRDLNIHCSIRDLDCLRPKLHIREVTRLWNLFQEFIFKKISLRLIYLELKKKVILFSCTSLSRDQGLFLLSEQLPSETRTT